MELTGARSRLFRRILVPAEFTFFQLHEILQLVMPWDDVHLHELEVAGLTVGMADVEEVDMIELVADEKRVRLSQLLKEEGQVFRYTYDFGDDWRHKITVDAIKYEPHSESMPRLLEGKGLAPEEDSRSAPSTGRSKRRAAAFDMAAHDANLESARRGWIAQGLKAAEPAPKLLVWIHGDEMDGCVSCGADVANEGMLLDVVRATGEVTPTWFDAFACGDCNTRHAFLDDLTDDGEIDVGTIQGFLWDGTDVPASVHTPEDPPRARRTRGREASPLVPWGMLRDASAQADKPPPSPAELLDLPIEAGSWEALVCPAAWVHESDESSPQLLYAALIVDAQGLVRACDMIPEDKTRGEALVESILRALGAPMAPLSPARPARLIVASEATLTDAQRLALNGVCPTIEAGPTPRATEAFESLGAKLAGDAAPAWMHREKPETLRAYFDACAVFLKARPWRNVPVDAFLAVRIRDDPWLYVTVMGGGGTGERGIVTFTKWRDVKAVLKLGSSKPT
ncbi:MAG: plasmid pRiA4b ORF-3 family protein, partial [Candidatus Thermoplasmatota archaeon]